MMIPSTRRVFSGTKKLCRMGLIINHRYSSYTTNNNSERFGHLTRKYKRTLKRFQYCSDLHIDKNGFPKIEPRGEHLLIAGDLSNGWTNECEQYIYDLTQKFKTVNLVLGNHDNYNDDEDGMMGILFKIREIEKKLFPKFYVLDNENMMFYEDDDSLSNVLLVGTTLWSDIPEKHTKHYQERFYDFKRIRYDENRYLTVNDYNQMHQESILYLNDVYRNEIQRWCKDMNKDNITNNNDMNNKNTQNMILGEEMPIVIFMSHHAPLIKNTCRNFYLRHRLKSMNHGFCTDLSPMLNKFTMQNNICFVWIFGHTHYRTEFVSNNGIHFGSNSLGLINANSNNIGKVQTRTLDGLVFS